MRPWLSSLPCLLSSLFFLDFSNALRMPINGKRTPTLVPREAGVSSLNNSADISYYTDITLNGTTFSVLIDTGRYVWPQFTSILLKSFLHYSSDLWVVGDVSGAVKTGSSASVTYAVGSVSGA